MRAAGVRSSHSSSLGVIRVSRRPTAADRASRWQGGGGSEVGDRARCRAACGGKHSGPVRHPPLPEQTVTRRETAARPPSGFAVVCGTQRAVWPRSAPPHSNGRGGGLRSRPFANRRRPGGMMASAPDTPVVPAGVGRGDRARSPPRVQIWLSAGGTTAFWLWREWGERGVGEAAVARLVGGARGRW